MSKPEALRLADQLKERYGNTVPTSQSAAELRRQHSEIEQLKAENFALAAGQCVNVTNDEGGRAYCAQIETLKAERDALRSLLNQYLPHSEWSEKHIHPYDGETFQNWVLPILLPVPLSETDKSPEAALSRAIKAREVQS